MKMRAMSVLGTGVVLSACAGVLGQGFTFQGIPELRGVNGIRPDGVLVVGQTQGLAAAVWSMGGGTSVLPTAAASGSAWSISADGSVIVGGGGPGAVRWVNGVPQILGDRVATGVSWDGQTIIGDANIDGRTRAVRWNAAGVMTPLALLPGSTGSLTAGVSGDGMFAVGVTTFGGVWEASLWTGDECIGLGHLLPHGSVVASLALAASFDGSVVVGLSNRADELLAFRWTSTTGMQALPLTAGATAATAFAVNSDGAVIAGSVFSPTGGERAAFWSLEYGAVDLTALLESQGINMSGWNLQKVRAVSADGLTLAGTGIGPGGEQGWVATIPAPGMTGILLATGVLAARRRRY